MKKIITCVGLFAITLSASAQGIEIYYPDGDEVISGTVVELNSGDDSMHQEFDVKNTSGATLNLRIERIKITELEGTQDYLCWGANPETGACYSAGAVSPENPFITPDASDLEDGGRGWLATYHVTNGIDGCAQYRYYVIDDSDIRLDSVDVLYCSTVSIKEDLKVTVSVYPNPASNFVNVVMENEHNNVDFTLYNILGEAVVTAKLNAGTNEVALNKLPNGVYFYSILKEGNILETKKLIVRH
ncbi:MAG: T9SS type A sorting domain-containing protein [Crocinitomix sp.]|nr:T9SS type A sorting domain-containing protein [Crocinitomix sp.]